MSSENPNVVEVTQDSKLTPISKQKIHEVKGHQWGDMKTSQLNEQLEILENRYNMALQMKQVSLAQQIQQGVQQLRTIISTKSTSSKDVFY